MDTREGLHYDKQTGITSGLPCDGVVSPSTSSTNLDNRRFDVVVIGAGYAGLVASRDLATRGYKTILLEARDRIGGRTWTSKIEGYPYEMGGTWVHWSQPHVWSELSKYGLLDELQDSREREFGLMCHTFDFKDGKKDVSCEEEEKIRLSGMSKFVNVDGALGKTILPNPHKPFTESAKFAAWDKVTAAERIKQLGDQLTPDERDVIVATLATFAGASADKLAFTEILRWWSLAGYDGEPLMDYTQRWKLRCGQTGFALRIFQDAKASGKLSYSFSDPVEVIDQTGETVKVTTKGGRSYTASYIISTVPLNVLNTVKFLPPLTQAKEVAANKGHINLCTKSHAEVTGRDYRTWSASSPNPVAGVFGDGITPSGNTHLVSFAANDAFEQGDDHGFASMTAAFENLKPYEIRRIVYHPWATDEYSKGTWCMYSPGFASRYLRALQAPQGRVLFASSDWADGWRGFIDGAIEQGLRASASVVQRLRQVVSPNL